jgi:hypothetical protein
MDKVRSRRTGRELLRLACRLVFPASGSWWHVPPPEAFASANDADRESVREPVVDPRELDAWLREVLGDAGDPAGLRRPESGRKRRRPAAPPSA